MPPADLDVFLSTGPPPVYVGFGSMAGDAPERATSLVAEALERAGHRGIVAGAVGDLPPTVIGAGSVPHEWLFPRTAAVVHHGGAGTTAAVVRAGVPSVVVPFMGDQPFWGRRVHALGVAPAPIPRKRLTVARLADAIRVAATDGDMRRKAEMLGETVSAEDGIGRAVSVLERLFG